MKGACLQTRSGCAPEFAYNPRPHLRRGIVCVGKRQNFVGPRVALTNKICYTLREHSSLPSARPRNHKHWAMNMSNGSLLALIKNDLSRG
jgi:hypothetical protein